MSDFTEEIPGQIAAIINRLGGGKYTHMSIYPLPPDAEYDATIHPTEWIQTTGIAPDRLTVEIKRRDSDGVHRLYTLGHPQAAEAGETEIIYNGDNQYLVRPAEVLTTAEAIGLFQHYYDHHAVAPGWHLREKPEFSDTAVAAQHAQEQTSQGAAGDAVQSAHRAPVATPKKSASAQRRAKPKPAN